MWDSIKNFFKYRSNMLEKGQMAIMPEAQKETMPVPKGTQRNYSLTSLEAQRILVGISSQQEPTVTNETILSVPPMFGAIRFISDGVAMLDRRVEKGRPNGGKELAKDHPLQKLMQSAPHHYYGWFDLIQAWVANACLGNGYIRIHWDSKTMRPEQLEVMPNGMCWPEIVGKDIMYRISGEINGIMVTELLPHTDIIHLKGFSLNGLYGKTMSLTHKTTFSNALSSQEYSKSIFANSARPSIAIKYKERLDEEERANLKTNVINEMSGVNAAGIPLILDDGMDVQYLQWSPQEVAFIDFYRLTVDLVTMITKVPSDMLFDKGTGTYGSALQKNQNFMTHCLGPWIERIQENFNQKLFWAEEFKQRKYWFVFDPSVFTKMTPEAETKMAVDLVMGSIITINEAREKLGLNPHKDGEKLMGNINTLPLENITEVALAKYLSSAGEKIRNETKNNDNAKDEQPK